MGKGSKVEAAAARRAEVAGGVNGHVANGKKPKARKPEAGLTPAERRILEEERERKQSEADGAEAARDIIAAEAGDNLPSGEELVGSLRDIFVAGGAKLYHDGPTAPETAPKRKGGRKSKPEPEASPGASGEPTAGLPAVIPTVEVAVIEEPWTEEEDRERAEEIAAIHANEDRAVEITVSTGGHLKTLLEKRLYRKTHGDFASFVDANFSFTVQTAYRLISARDAVANLEAAGVENLPSSGRVASALASNVSPEKQAEVWRAAEELATGEGEEEPRPRHVVQAAAAAGAIVTGPTGKRGRPKGSKNKDKPGAVAKGKKGSQEPTAAVERGKAEGVIPAGAQVEIASNDGETDEEREAREAATSGPVSDEEWLDSFPIRDSLTVNTRRVFDVAALSYRHLEEGLQEFRSKHLRPAAAVAEAILAGDVGPYLIRFQWAARTRHPSQWKLCDSCKGTGQLTKSKGQCLDCKGNAFHL
jgi:hypothetical protein